jgi:YndJ-like protein
MQLPGPVELLFLLIAFVAVPFGLDVLGSLGYGDRLVRLARVAVLPAAVALAISLALPPGPVAAVVALPWLATTGLLGISALADRARRGVGVDRHLIPEGALGFAAIGGLLVLDHRLGADPFGFSQFLVLLAAVHFHVAGFIMLTTVAALADRRDGRAPLVAGALAIVGGPLTAVGFFGLPGVNICGAAFTVAAGLLVGGLHLVTARGTSPRHAAILLGIAGASLLITMPMAAIWAVGLLTGVELLPLDAMTRIHGGLNAVGFGLAAMVGWRMALAADDNRR